MTSVVLAGESGSITEIIEIGPTSLVRRRSWANLQPLADACKTAGLTTASLPYGPLPDGLGHGSRPTPACCCAQLCDRRILAVRRPWAAKRVHRLLDDRAALRRPDGDPRPRPMEEDRCHSTEV